MSNKIDITSFILNSSWKEAIFKIIKDQRLSIIKDLKDLYLTKTIFPSQENIFKCFNFFELKETKVVFLGQDPYFKKNQANGLSFSVNNDQICPPSLKNIFKELENDLKIRRTKTNLEDWATQGILLLNSILTVEENKPLSHKNLEWEILTNELLKEIYKQNKDVVFVLLGNYAKSKTKFLDNQAFIVKTSHPSPFSFHKGFDGSKIFSQINKMLIGINQKPIKW